jgi:hypothetical protein
MADHQGKLYSLEEIGLVGGVHSPSSKDHQGKLLKIKYNDPEAPVSVQPLKFTNGKVRRIATNESVQLATVGLGTVPSTDSLSIIPGAANRKAIVVRAYSSQSAVLAEFQDDGQVTYFSIDADGKPIAREDFKLEGPNGEAMVWKRASEELTGLSGASVDTSGDARFPANCTGIAVGVRTTTALGTGNGTTGYEVGVAGDTTRFGTVVGTAADQTNEGHSVDDYSALSVVRLTATGGNFDGNGAVRVSIFYLQASAPTS